MDPVMVRAGTLARLRTRIDELERGARGCRAQVAVGEVHAQSQPATHNLQPAFPQASKMALHLWPGAAAPRGVLHEVRAGDWRDAPAALGFAVAVAARLAEKKGALVFIERAHNPAFAALSGRGLAAFGLDPARALFVRTRTDMNALWAAEEAARSESVAAAILLLGKTKRLTLTATRRLHLAAGKSGATPIIVRTEDGSATTTAAAMRWRVEPRPSGAAPFDAKAPGRPRWRVTIEKAPRLAADGRSFLVEWRHDRFVLADEDATDFGARVSAPFRRSPPPADGGFERAARAS